MNLTELFKKYDEKVISDFIAYVGENYLNEFDDIFQGVYNSFEDFAREFYEDFEEDVFAAFNSEYIQDLGEHYIFAEKSGSVFLRA